MDEQDEVPFDQLVRIYLKMRGKIRTLTTNYEAAVAEVEAQKETVASALREHMKKMGTKSVRTDYGTVSLSLKTRYFTNDWDSFKEFVRENNLLDLFERRISQRNMATFLEENKDRIPPGLNSDSTYEISVRKPQ